MRAAPLIEKFLLLFFQKSRFEKNINIIKMIPQEITEIVLQFLVLLSLHIVFIRCSFFGYSFE